MFSHGGFFVEFFMQNTWLLIQKCYLLHKLLYKTEQEQYKRERQMSDYAIFQTGGKQYRVKAGDVIKVEKLNADGTVEFDQVLMLGDKIGTPFVDGARVIADVVEQKRGDKVLVFKKKRRQNYRRTRGHRQHITVLKITEIKG